MEGKPDRGKLWHFVVAAAVGLVVCAVGASREWVRHGLTLTYHQLAEALAWPFGLMAIGAWSAVVIVTLFLLAGREED